MKCPLLSIIPMTEHYPGNPNPEDCLKEECAWWDVTAAQCAIPQLAFELDEIHCWLEKLVDKMPTRPTIKR